MFPTIIFAFVSIIILIILHEFGHFITARRFGVRVEEFGLGYPPRVFGKKIGETVYSLNLLPFGGFVKLFGEEKDIKDPRSFSSKPIWQRSLIVAAGVISFWIISAILFAFIFWQGATQQISDEETFFLTTPKVQITSIAKNSPAEKAGLGQGDTVKRFAIGEESVEIGTVKRLQELTTEHAGKEIILTIERGKQLFDVQMVPRISPPDGEGAMGVALIRTSIVSYPWYTAPFYGIQTTFNLTILLIKGWGSIFLDLVRGVPTGVQIVGPIGVFGLATQMSQLGIIYFLQFIAIISINLAFLNILPIPALDGGKLLFLAIEKVRGKPISEKVEQSVTTFFFILLIALVLLITLKDVQKLF